MSPDTKSWSIFTNTLHISVLFSFCAAQPLFDLTSRNSEFYVARHSEPIDLLFFVIVISIAIPGGVGLAEWLASKSMGDRFLKVFHFVVIAVLMSAIAILLLQKAGDFSTLFILVGALLVGTLAAYIYLRCSLRYTYLTILSPSVVLFPMLFLFNSPVSQIVFLQERDLPVFDLNFSDTPIVFVVFDELPLTSLMNQDRQIDNVQYPNFADLANDGTS